MPLTQLPQMCTTTVQVPKLRTVVNIVRHWQSVDGVAIVIRCPLTSLFCPGSHPESHLPWVVTPPNCDSSQFVGTMTLWKSTGPWLRRKSLNLDLFSPDYSRVLHFGHGFPDTCCRALPGPWEAARGLETLVLVVVTLPLVKVVCARLLLREVTASSMSTFGGETLIYVNILFLIIVSSVHSSIPWWVLHETITLVFEKWSYFQSLLRVLIGILL